MDEPTVTVEAMTQAFRRFRQAERELYRLTGYRKLTPGMKHDRDKWHAIRAENERFLQTGHALPLPKM